MYFLTIVTIWRAVKENMKMTINKRKEKYRELHIENYEC